MLEVWRICDLLLIVCLGAVSGAAVAHIRTIFKLQELSESAERCCLLRLVLALTGRNSLVGGRGNWVRLTGLFSSRKRLGLLSQYRLNLNAELFINAGASTC